MVSASFDVMGKKYQDVTDAYIQAVHSVLMARRVRRKLPQPWRMMVRITGFKKGRPLGKSAHPGIEF